MTDRSTKSAAFTIVELMVAIVIVLILLSIFVPYLVSVREQSRRIACGDNLRLIANGLWAYSHDNGEDFPRVIYDPATMPNGYVSFTGVNDEDPFKAGTTATNDVRPSDVSASLFLLLRLNYVVQPNSFICPSSDDVADVVTDRTKRGNFTSGHNLSYSYAMPFSSSPDYKFNHDRLKSAFVLLADKNPGIGPESDPTKPASTARPVDLARGNSINHDRAGQNVVDATGSIEFKVSPYCGYQDDNIYTAQAPVPTTQPATAPNVNGVLSQSVGPARPDDSYLVPTATDEAR